MASTYSDLKVELIGTGEQTGTWGTTTNNNLSIALGEAITGSADVSFSGADVTLTLTDTNAAQTARNLRLNLTGTSGGARNLILGSGCQIEKLYLVNNGLADAVTVKNTTGTGVAVPAGKSMFVFNNGTNVVEATSGDVFGPSSATDNAIARFDGTTGKLIQNSVVTIADTTGNMAGVGTISSGAITSSSLTSGRVLYAGASGLIQDDADFTFNGTTVTMANDASINSITVGRAGGNLASNTIFGNSSFGSNTAGQQNSGFGYQALLSVTNADSNAAFGSQVMRSNTTGSNNTAMGNQALYSNTTASGNTAVGYQTLYSNTNGAINTAVGYQAGYATTTGFGVNALGYQALYANTTGNANNSFGSQALANNTTGSANVAMGHEALKANTTASNNTAVGYQAAFNNTTGTTITAVGGQALYSNTTGLEQVAVGRYAMYNTTTGGYNTAVGVDSLFTNTTGANNVAIGRQALLSNTTASNNTAVGYQAGYSNTTGANNVAIGWQAGYSQQTSNYNTFVGKSAGYSCSVSGDSYNTALGYQAGYYLTTGLYNLFVGGNAGLNATTGSNNTFVGSINCGSSMTTGSKNTILGGYSGNQGGLDIRTASNYIVLSDGDGNPRIVSNASGQVGINTVSQNTMLGINGASSTISGYTPTSFYVTQSAGDMVAGIRNSHPSNPFGMQIAYTGASPNGSGNEFLQCVDSGPTVRITLRSNGGIGNYSANNANLSDERTKKDIQLAGNYLDKICAIPVKTFLYKDQEDTDLNLGVIAQDVEKIAPELVDANGFGETPEDGVPLKAIYQTDLQYALMKCIQELKAEVDSLKAQLNK